MRFTVTRTSQYGHETPPCEWAERQLVPYVDRRGFASEEEHDARFPAEPWRSRGVSHRLWEKGDERGIERVVQMEAWTIEIDTLDELIAFADAHGEIIVGAGDPPSIEIYDDYRE